MNRPNPIRALAALALAAFAARAGAQPSTSAPTPGTGPVAPPVSSLPSQVVVDILGAKGARIPSRFPSRSPR